MTDPQTTLQQTIDPLRREFVPTEHKTPKGTTVFRTSDNLVYARVLDGSIRRAIKKTRGKSARCADKRARISARGVTS